MTVATYREAVRNFVRVAWQLALPDDVRRLGHADLGRYVQALRLREQAANTISHRLRPLSVFFQWLISRGVLRVNPMEYNRRPRPGDNRVRPPTPDEIAALLAQCEAPAWLARRDRVESGYRIGSPPESGYNPHSLGL